MPPVMMTLGFCLLCAAVAIGRLAWRSFATDPIQPTRPAIPRFPRTSTTAPTLVDKLDRWFADSLFFLNWGISQYVATLTLALIAFAAGGATLVTTDSLSISFMAACWSLLAGLAAVYAAKQWRRRQFQDRFPAALDLLSRAVRAGESFDQAVALVGSTAAEPVATEFRRVAKHLEMGLSVSSAMQSMSNRMDLVDVRIFSSAVSVNRTAGGNISETLDRLARVIRERLSYHRQVRTATAASRASVLVVATLAPVIFIYLFVFQPQYGQRLWHDPLGRSMLLFAFVSQLIGLLWVSRLLKLEY